MVAVLLAVFTACGQADDVPATYVRIAISSNPKSLDPAQMTDVNGGDVGAKIYNGLVKFNGLDVAPDLADTWTVTPDGLVYRFQIREDVLFHHGRALTAHDVVASFARLLDTATKSKRRWVLDAVDTFAAPSDHALILHLKAPSAAFLALLAMPAGYVIPVEEATRLGDDFSHHAVGTGPYRLVSWEDDRRVVLARNESYFAGAPGAAGIVYDVIPEPLTQLALLKRGALDVCEIPDAQLPRFQADDTWRDRVRSADQLVTGYIAINTERFPDLRVRRAFNLAVDRGRIITSVRNGLATPAAGAVPPALSAVTGPGYGFDTTFARRLLEEAHFDRTRPIVLLRNAPRGTLEPAEAVAGYLRDLGLTVRVEALEFSSLMVRINRGDYDLCLLNWFADYPDAENFLTPLFHSKNIGSAGNRARLKDPVLDAALDRLGTLPAGPTRQDATARAETLVVDTAPWIFLWYPRAAVAVSPRLDGYTMPMIFNGEKGEHFVVRTP